MPFPIPSVCLLRRESRAHVAFSELRKAGVPISAISILGGRRPADILDRIELCSIGTSESSYGRLLMGLLDGGWILSVSATREHAAEVEKVFQSLHTKRLPDPSASVWV